MSLEDIYVRFDHLPYRALRRPIRDEFVDGIPDRTKSNWGDILHTQKESRTIYELYLAAEQKHEKFRVHSSWARLISSGGVSYRNRYRNVVPATPQSNLQSSMQVALPKVRHHLRHHRKCIGLKVHMCRRL